MIGSEYVERGSIPEPRNHHAKLLGVGAGAPTIVFGRGFTVARLGAGDYTLTWSETAGLYINTYVGLESTAGTDVKNFSLIIIPFVQSTRVLEVKLFNGSGTATDLAAAQWINLQVLFSETRVT